MNRPAVILAVCATAALAACAVRFGGTPASGNSAVEKGISQDIRATGDLGPSGILAGTPQPNSGARPPASANQRTTSPGPEASGPQPSPTSPYQSIPGSGDKQAGRRFALDNCRPCHVVAGDQSSSVRFANAPNFSAVANDPKTTAFELNMWLTNPHPIMPTLVLTTQESADVIAYIMSLRGQH